MPGGLLQLVAYGQANIILTGEPKTTFFKSSYKKYTPFVCKDLELITKV